MASVWKPLRKAFVPRRGAALVALIGMLARTGVAWAAGPQPWEIDMRPPATPVMQRLEAFHNELLVIIFLIALFVLGLLLYVMVRFSARRHPVPTRTSHHTVIELLWTTVPVLILVVIAIPSFKLMYYMDKAAHPQMTVKVTGHQWYWSYAYPDDGGLSFDSNLVPADQLKAGQPRLLTVNNPLVVPASTTVRVLITSTDVIHSWFVPEFGVQEYAVPGRLNESWFRVEHPGTYYGQCNQLCGVNHAFMPIEIKAMSKSDFERWLTAAKKKFAQDRGGILHVAANRGARGAASPQPGGN